MDMGKPVSKVLVLDNCPAHVEAIKRAGFVLTGSLSAI